MTAETAALREALPSHRRGEWTEEGWADFPDGLECKADGDHWPCEAVRALAALREHEGRDAEVADEAGVRKALGALTAVFREHAAAELAKEAPDHPPECLRCRSTRSPIDV